ncbi:hypothetical protein [Chelativorans sp. AA-79]|uniref:hypothetical protein n=1 Tax=Chelativorans sp. AA-79 TaxID=3028735 RepID=UPI0023F7B405|nr:hypothetical protein [Chelativorans sp. AA-79]WEX10568.1 hypothetical protein PVE73_06315 [Chelativorans sp. AA-79]
MRLVAWLGGGLFAVIILSGLAVAGLLALFFHLRQPADVMPLETVEQVPPAPRLETAPEGDRIAIEREAKSRLEGYAWADRSAGTARIPIERAMELVAKEDWPDGEGGRR